MGNEGNKFADRGGNVGGGRASDSWNATDKPKQETSRYAESDVNRALGDAPEYKLKETNDAGQNVGKPSDKADTRIDGGKDQPSDKKGDNKLSDKAAHHTDSAKGSSGDKKDDSKPDGKADNRIDGDKDQSSGKKDDGKPSDKADHHTDNAKGPSGDKRDDNKSGDKADNHIDGGKDQSGGKDKPSEKDQTDTDGAKLKGNPNEKQDGGKDQSDSNKGDDKPNEKLNNKQDGGKESSNENKGETKPDGDHSRNKDADKGQSNDKKPEQLERSTDRTIPSKDQLTKVGRSGGKDIYLRTDAASAYEQMKAAARKDGINGPNLEPHSGFRDPKVQEKLWKEAVQKHGSEQEARKWVAPPGRSAHQTGRAIDMNLGYSPKSEFADQMQNTEAYKWLKEHAHEYGFAPYAREPWHWEYTPNDKK